MVDPALCLDERTDSLLRKYQGNGSLGLIESSKYWERKQFYFCRTASRSEGPAVAIHWEIPNEPKPEIPNEPKGRPGSGAVEAAVRCHPRFNNEMWVRQVFGSVGGFSHPGLRSRSAGPAAAIHLEIPNEPKRAGRESAHPRFNNEMGSPEE
jgi:hypothetical protein